DPPMANAVQKLFEAGNPSASYEVRPSSFALHRYDPVCVRQGPPAAAKRLYRTSDRRSNPFLAAARDRRKKKLGSDIMVPAKLFSVRTRALALLSAVAKWSTKPYQPGVMIADVILRDPKLTIRWL